MSDWQSVPFGRIAKKLVNGGTPPTEVPRYWNGQIPWVTGADFTPAGIGEFRRFVSDEAIRETATNVIEEGQLLLVTRTGVGKLAIAPCNIAISQDVTGVYVDEEQADTVFLFHRMRQGVEDLKKLNQGTSINGIIRSDLVSYPVKLPPLTQQRRIAEILSTLDEAIEQTEALIAKMQQVKAGLMHDLFTRGVTPDGRLRPTREQAPELYKESAIGWIPREWGVEPLTAFAASGTAGIVNGPFGSDLLTSELKESGVPVIYVKDIKENEYRRVSDAHVTEEKANSLNFCNVRFGDVLIAKVGDPPCSATPYLWEERSIVTQDVIRIRPADDVNTEFLACLINSPLGKKIIKRIVIEGTRSRVSLGEFKRLHFPRPGHDEQSLVAGKIFATQRLISAFEGEIESFQDQKYGLMHDLLTGSV